LYPNFDKLVGSGPSQASYDKVDIDAEHRPVNGMTNFGAIANAILVMVKVDADPKLEMSAEEFILKKLEHATGHNMNINEEVAKQDVACADAGDYNNNVNAFEGKTLEGKDFPEARALNENWAKNNVRLDIAGIKAGLRLFLRICAVDVNSKDLARIGSVFRNGGASTIDGRPIFSKSAVEGVTKSMSRGGLYAETADIANTTNGLPSKSGIGGGWVSFGNAKEIPFAFGGVNPRLSESGNSIPIRRALETFVQETDAGPAASQAQ
jgi:glutaminase